MILIESPTITCPICERTLGKNESLQIGYDLVGTLIVRHMVPDSVPYLGSRGIQDAEDLHDAIRNAPFTSHEEMRSICGSAGFREFSIAGRKG